MKKRLVNLLGLGLLLATVSANAQSIYVKANIPFNFVVTGATLPAGTYSIRSMSLDGRALSISAPDVKVQSMVLALPCKRLEPSTRTKLLFHRYGDQYFLTEIWVAGRQEGHAFRKSPRETEVAKDFTMKEVVLLASLR